MSNSRCLKSRGFFSVFIPMVANFAVQKAITLSTTATACKKKSMIKTQMLYIAQRVGCGNSTKACNEVTQPNHFHRRGLHHYSCSQTDFSRLTCTPCFPSGFNTLENIRALERTNTRAALELQFPEQKKLFFLLRECEKIHVSE